MTANHEEQALLGAIDAHRDELLRFGHTVQRLAEAGYHEVNTARLFAEKLRALGLETQTGLAITGVRADLRYGPGPHVALLGELDALACPTHPLANAETGMAHACGHHQQLTAVLGAAMALTQCGLMAHMAGDVAFFGVPSEEYSDADGKRAMIRQGRIGLAGGKQELLRLGAFADIDAAVTCHTHYQPAPQKLLMGSAATNGSLLKRAAFRGRAAHAAGAPHQGVNALCAASLAINALGLIRETFRDEDAVRVAAVMGESDHIVNVIPAHATLNLQLRANNTLALEKADAAADRCLRAGALALGAEVEIDTLPGYLPSRMIPATPWQAEIADVLTQPGESRMLTGPESVAISTDVGDLTQVMPVFSFTMGGSTGALHSAAYQIIDEETAYILPAKVMALSVYRLLRDGAAELKRAASQRESYLPLESYLKALGQENRTQTYPAERMENP